jgi:transcriptional regulator with XRE-family HTH domain
MEEERAHGFGYWLRRRRKALDLTQEALAAAVACSRFAIRKIEADERRPSRRLAERLAEKLGSRRGARGLSGRGTFGPCGGTAARRCRTGSRT